MKPKIDKTSIFSMMFILCLLAVPGFYPYFISKTDAQKGIQVGEATYKLLKVNRRTLQLKIIEGYRS